MACAESPSSRKCGRPRLSSAGCNPPFPDIDGGGKVPEPHVSEGMILELTTAYVRGDATLRLPDARSTRNDKFRRRVRASPSHQSTAPRRPSPQRRPFAESQAARDTLSG